MSISKKRFNFMLMMILIYILIYIISLILSFIFDNFIFMVFDILIYCFIFVIIIKEDTNLYFNDFKYIFRSNRSNELIWELFYLILLFLMILLNIITLKVLGLI